MHFCDLYKVSAISDGVKDYDSVHKVQTLIKEYLAELSDPVTVLHEFTATIGVVAAVHVNTACHRQCKRTTKDRLSDKNFTGKKDI